MKRAITPAAFLVVSALAAGAWAQKVSASCPERPAGDEAARSAAKQWFQDGEALFSRRKYAEALESFQCSLRMFPHRVTIYNASQAALFAGERRTAMLLMEQYLAIAPDGEAAEVTRKALEKLAMELSEQPPSPEAEKVEEEAEAAAPVEAESHEAESHEAEPPPLEEEPPAEKKGLGLAPLIVSAALTAGLGAGTVVLDFKVGERFERAEKTGESSDRESAESLQLVERILLGATAAGVITTGVMLLFFLTNTEKDAPDDEYARGIVTPLVLDRGAGLALTREF